MLATHRTFAVQSCGVERQVKRVTVQTLKLRGQRYVLPGGLELIGHMGTGAGYRMLMFHLPAQHIDFTLAMNRPGDPMPVLVPMLQLITG